MIERMDRERYERHAGIKPAFIVVIDCDALRHRFDFATCYVACDHTNNLCIRERETGQALHVFGSDTWWSVGFEEAQL